MHLHVNIDDENKYVAILASIWRAYYLRAILASYPGHVGKSRLIYYIYLYTYMYHNISKT